jgi:hypothetical protein
LYIFLLEFWRTVPLVGAIQKLPNTPTKIVQNLLRYHLSVTLDCNKSTNTGKYDVFADKWYYSTLVLVIVGFVEFFGVLPGIPCPCHYDLDVVGNTNNGTW